MSLTLLSRCARREELLALGGCSCRRCPTRARHAALCRMPSTAPQLQPPAMPWEAPRPRVRCAALGRRPPRPLSRSRCRSPSHRRDTPPAHCRQLLSGALVSPLLQACMITRAWLLCVPTGALVSGSAWSWQEGSGCLWMLGPAFGALTFSTALPDGGRNDAGAKSRHRCLAIVAATSKAAVHGRLPRIC